MRMSRQKKRVIPLDKAARQHSFNATNTGSFLLSESDDDFPTLSYMVRMLDGYAVAALIHELGELGEQQDQRQNVSSADNDSEALCAAPEGRLQRCPMVASELVCMMGLTDEAAQVAEAPKVIARRPLNIDDDIGIEDATKTRATKELDYPSSATLLRSGDLVIAEGKSTRLLVYDGLESTFVRTIRPLARRDEDGVLEPAKHLSIVSVCALENRSRQDAAATFFKMWNDRSFEKERQTREEQDSTTPSSTPFGLLRFAKFPWEETHLLVGCDDGVMLILDTITGEILYTLNAYVPYPSTAVPLPNGQLLGIGMDSYQKEALTVPGAGSVEEYNKCFENCLINLRDGHSLLVQPNALDAMVVPAAHEQRRAVANYHSDLPRDDKMVTDRDASVGFDMLVLRSSIRQVDCWHFDLTNTEWYRARWQRSSGGEANDLSQQNGAQPPSAEVPRAKIIPDAVHPILTEEPRTGKHIARWISDRVALVQTGFELFLFGRKSSSEPWVKVATQELLATSRGFLLDVHPQTGIVVCAHSFVGAVSVTVFPDIPMLLDSLL